MAFADEATTDLSELTFGDGWKIDTSEDYSGPQYKRFDGLEFTRIVNTSGFDVPEGMTIDDNDRVWMFELKSGLVPKRCGRQVVMRIHRSRMRQLPVEKSQI